MALPKAKTKKPKTAATPTGIVPGQPLRMAASSRRKRTTPAGVRNLGYAK